MIKLKPKTANENEKDKEKEKEKEGIIWEFWFIEFLKETVAGKEEEKKRQLPQKTESQKNKDAKASALVDYSSGDSDLETTSRKKVKLDNKKII